jgi:RND superfamily putative drug exporter
MQCLSFSFLIRRGPFVILFWLVLAAALFFTAPRLSDVASYSNQGFLPDSAPSRTADRILGDITAETTGRTQLLLVAHRDTGLSADDRVWLGAAAARAAAEPAWRIMGSHIQEAADGRTAVAILFVDDSAWSKEVSATVGGLRTAIASGGPGAKPAGLSAHVSGEAAFSTDEHAMVNASMDLITKITVVVILLVLVLLFRSPVTPLVPLSVIGLSFLIARSAIAFLSLAGYAVSAYTETFLIAVLFGAGTDYCLLIISRYREELHRGLEAPAALSTAMSASIGAILSSGGTVIIGFLCMGLASFGLFNATGPAVAIGVAIALMMVATLTPAIIGLLGPKVFWPLHPEKSRRTDDSRSRRWDRLAALVTRRPRRILLLSLAGFLPFLVALGFSQRSFDQLSELPVSADSMRGFGYMKESFGQGEVLPLRLVLETERDLWNPKSQQAVEKAVAALRADPGVAAVRAATRPDGRRLDQLMDPPGDPSQPLNLPKMVIANNPELKAAMSVYLSSDGHHGYLDVVLRVSPYSAASLDLTARLEETTRRALAGGWLEGATVRAGGATAMFRDVREITATDFVLVVGSVFVGVFVVLALLLRSLIAPVYLLLTILLSYASTMGITTLLFQGILGYPGVNWAVPFFAFVVLVALGVDYNIFLMSRVREEYRPGDTTGAVARALAQTGRIITSCGIIMAGTFSAMMVSPVRSIIEVGFATVVGLLIDTFIIRSLIVGAVAVLVGERNWWPGRRQPIIK